MSKYGKKTKPAAGSTIRLIGGNHRGRKLPIPALEGLRPTSDRIRETVFNWLQFDLPGMRVLDLFSGTGALGMEALSRDAKEAVFVEPQAQAASGIKQSLITLNLTNAQVLNQTSEQFLSSPAEPFDLIFVDPPFALDLWQNTLNKLADSHWLADNGLIYVECPKHQQFDVPDCFQTEKDKTAGQVRFRLLRRAV